MTSGCRSASFRTERERRLPVLGVDPLGQPQMTPAFAAQRIAGDQHLRRGVEERCVAGGVTRRMHGDPAVTDRGAILDRARHLHGARRPQPVGRAGGEDHWVERRADSRQGAPPAAGQARRLQLMRDDLCVAFSYERRQWSYMIEIAVGDSNRSQVARPAAQFCQAGSHAAPRPRPTAIEQDRLSRGRLVGLRQPEVSVDAADAAKTMQTGDDFCAAAGLPVQRQSRRRWPSARLGRTAVEGGLDYEGGRAATPHDLMHCRPRPQPAVMFWSWPQVHPPQPSPPASGSHGGPTHSPGSPKRSSYSLIDLWISALAAMASSQPSGSVRLPSRSLYTSKKCATSFRKCGGTSFRS